jgi:hypothetical protein
VFLAVEPWGKFSPALNALIGKACSMDMEFILFCSLEVEPDLKVVEVLLKQFDEDTLVVGKVLQGHEFTPGINELKGTTCPWNTFAVWRLDKLVKTGFLLVSEGLIRDTEAGVEEVSVIALHSHLFNYKAKLVKVNGSSWNTDWHDKGRQEWHEAKMRSKDSRPAKHLEILGLTGAKVEHVDLS